MKPEFAMKLTEAARQVEEVLQPYELDIGFWTVDKSFVHYNDIPKAGTGIVWAIFCDHEEIRHCYGDTFEDTLQDLKNKLTDLNLREQNKEEEI